MEQTNPSASAKDFFLHLGMMVTLYAIVISFLNLVFKIINKTYPEVASYYYYWGGGSEISMPVATLIIVFPIFILLSWLVYKSYLADEFKKHLAVRRWLTYITLFVAGIILVGDLVTVLYKFLDGQDLTAAFLLKALSVLVVTGFVFGFFLQDIRDRVSASRRKIWAIVPAIVVLAAIIFGFSVLGSPATQRMLREDNMKITELQNLQGSVINSYQQTGVVPATLQMSSDYEYRKTGNLNFELCATFNRPNTMQNSPGGIMVKGPKSSLPQMENWDHAAGRHCFERTIDMVAYPVYNRQTLSLLPLISLTLFTLKRKQDKPKNIKESARRVQI